MPGDASLIHALRDEAVLPHEAADALADRLTHGWASPAEAILRASAAAEDRLLPWLARRLGLGYAESLADEVAAEGFLDLVPPEYARRMGVVARRITEEDLDLAVTPGPDLAAVLCEMGRLFGRRVTASLAPRREVESAVDRSVRQRAEYLADTVHELGGDDLAGEAARIERVTDFGELMRKTPVVKLVSLLIAQAVRTRSSDIHFQPAADGLRVRFRTDGVLHDALTLPRSAQDAVLSRVKVLGRMDIAERRAPQDGRATFRYADREIDVRMSVVPTDEGERAVLRLLDKQTKLLALEDLGLDQDNLRRFQEMIRQTHGMILVTGPTGSGKTTTLYAALARIASPEVNVITIEDPVEYKLPGVSQIQVLPQKNVTFHSLLRSVVRQDPNVIMIGEIRDEEAASIAVHAALTGHLVFSTLHTNNSVGAVARLVKLGVDPYLISTAVLAVLAQRLVRRVCPACARDATPTAEEARLLDLSPERLAGARFRRAVGCDQCLKTGFLGRIGIFELLVIDDAVRRLINDRAPSSEVRDEAVRRGLRLLRADGAAKALAGVTTVDEVLRVTQRDEA